MEHLKWLVLLLALCLLAAIIVLVVYSGDDDDNNDKGNGDKDNEGKDNDGKDNDDEDNEDRDKIDVAANPILQSECDKFCTQKIVTTSNKCLVSLPNFRKATVSTCKKQCQAGLVDKGISICFQNFVDCKNLLNCVKPYIQ